MEFSVSTINFLENQRADIDPNMTLAECAQYLADTTPDFFRNQFDNGNNEIGDWGTGATSEQKEQFQQMIENLVG
jgi:hypothetical protein